MSAKILPGITSSPFARKTLFKILDTQWGITVEKVKPDTRKKKVKHSKFIYENRGHKIEVKDGKLIVLESPYFTNGKLDKPSPKGPRTYCLPHCFFKGNQAPYPVYSVLHGGEECTPIQTAW